MRFVSTDKFLFIGRSGTGKTYLCKQIQKIFPRRVIFDSMGEYTEKDFKDNDNFFIISNFTEFTNAISFIKDDKKFILVYRFDTEDELAETIFNASMDILYELGNVCIVIEEAQDYCSPYNIPPMLKKCMTSGRHRNIATFMTTQRPSLINGNVFSQATNIFCGNLIKKSDAQTMSDLLDIDRNEIKLLKMREFFWFNAERDTPTIKIKSENIKIS